MIYEDNILDYLDGALGDKESAELMHQLSVSPERRVILEQHLQLKNAISDARKPVPVPAAIEARLAERLPAIANYNRELVGSTMSGTSARSPYFGRVAAGIAALLLLGTTAYFGFLRNADTSKVPESAAVSDVTSKSASERSPVQQPSDVSSLTTTSPTSSGISNTPTKAAGGNGSRFRAPLASKDLPPVGGPAPQADESEQRDEFIQQETPAAETPELYAISSIDNIRTETQHALSIGERQSTFAMRTPLEEPSSIPLVLRVDYSIGQSYNQVRESDASLTTRTAYAPAIGIDYILSPYFALGVEGGQTEIGRVEEIANVVENEELGIKQVVVSHDVIRHKELNTRAMLRYTLNPYDRAQLEVSAGGGAAFGEAISPLFSLGVAVNPRITEAISLSVSLTFTGMYTRSGPSASYPDPGDGPIAYITTDEAASSTLFTPSGLAKVGLRIKPW